MTTRYRLPVIGLALFCVAALNAQNWTSIPSPVTSNLILYDITFPNAQNAIGFAGGSSLTYNGDGAILKTIDAGETWEVVWSSTVNGTGVTSLFFLDQLVGFAGTQAGTVMKTIDGGVNWTPTDFDPSNDQGEIYDMDFRDANNGVLCTAWNGIYYTVNGGNTWVPATTNPGSGQLSICYAGANTLFACGNDQSIYRSTDGGATWTSSYQGMFQVVNLGIHFMDANNGMVTSEEGAYFKTSNGGATWTAGTIPNQFGLMRGVVMLDVNNIFVCATPGQVFRTMNGGATWTDDSGVNQNSSYYNVIFTPNGTGFVGGSGANGGTILKRTPISTNVERIMATDVLFKAYPNPVSGILTIESEFVSGDQLEFTVVNGMGAVVHVQRSEPGNGELRREMIDLSRLAPGTYALKLTNGGVLIGSETFVVSGR